MTARVGIVKDERYLGHMPGHTHPEHPLRLKTVYRMVEKEFSDDLVSIEPEPATLEQLEFVHSSAYIQKVMKTADHDFTSLAPDTPASAGTYLASWLAAGGCIKGLDAMVLDVCDICFALIRPPGHHALADRAAGFCVFNNLGITARYAMKVHQMSRILIVDWDVHHGNGLNDLFYAEREVLYLSTHDTGLYPYSGEWVETGKGPGEGYTINIPIPRTLTDDDFCALYRGILAPVITGYSPELILVAAGFDAHRDDPIGRCRLTEKAFGVLTRLLLDLRLHIPVPPMLFALEGGYDPRSLSRSVREVLMAMSGRQASEMFPAGASGRAEELIGKARRIHDRYGIWTDVR